MFEGSEFYKVLLKTLPKHPKPRFTKAISRNTKCFTEESFPSFYKKKEKFNSLEPLTIIFG